MLSPTVAVVKKAARVSASASGLTLVIQLRRRGSRIEAIPRQVFDVCIAGWGPGGGIATYALAKAGLKVALVEAGPRLRAGIDYN
jgi:NADPH-dependent 2,4-dienoyl-CoA reductase/sulfur reductase-like enzyme